MANCIHGDRSKGGRCRNGRVEKYLFLITVRLGGVIHRPLLPSRLTYFRSARTTYVFFILQEMTSLRSNIFFFSYSHKYYLHQYCTSQSTIQHRSLPTICPTSYAIISKTTDRILRHKTKPLIQDQLQHVRCSVSKNYL